MGIHASTCILQIIIPVNKFIQFCPKVDFYVTLTGRITKAESLFVYKNGTSYEYYQDYDFVPQFRASFSSPEEEARAREICGNNSQCLYDYSQTQDSQFAANTRRIDEKHTAERAEESMYMLHMYINVPLYKFSIIHTYIHTCVAFK